MSTHVVNMGWERILPLKVYNNFKLGENLQFFKRIKFLFLVKRYDINFHKIKASIVGHVQLTAHWGHVILT